MPKAYVIADIEVIDPTAFEEYKRLSPPTVQLGGGRFLARGGDVEVLEGDAIPHRVVVLEFPDPETARAWYRSRGYQQARAFRARSAVSTFLLVEGL